MKKRIMQVLVAVLVLSIVLPFMSTKASAATGNEIVSYSKTLLGVPYRYGGTTASGFDCSGFTSYVYKKIGVSLNRTAADQYRQGTSVSKSNLQPGDLVFFNNFAPVSHVGIYIGSGKFISAESEGIAISSINDSYYWGKYYIGAKRIIKATVATPPPAPPVTDGNFADVTSSHPAYEAIKTLNVDGVINGFDNQEFRPEASVTRGQAAAMVNRVLKLTPKSTSKYSDVGTTHTFAKDIQAMTEAGILQGYTTGKFGVSDTLTKAQLAVIMDRAFKITSTANNQAHVASTYQDVAASFWAYDSIIALKVIDQTTLFQTSNFGTTKSADRAEFSAALYSAIETN
ncbi:C40 family peptidase [Paenisporosarcina cavernae]|uniref:Hydrolase n=1 Tax=Paenisporosarcina cavernae TaxID=2320858 RepID=A0A385YTJ3_9BACL|nr:C40 family peptidase [Paenisporosarcina cavernae]AYC28892.1 hypothetical protein D3873_03025 [Paenisporosarcina cavernae]